MKLFTEDEVRDMMVGVVSNRYAHDQDSILDRLQVAMNTATSRTTTEEYDAMRQVITAIRGEEIPEAGK